MGEESSPNFLQCNLGIQRCSLSERFFRIDARSLSVFQSDEIQVNKFEYSRGHPVTIASANKVDELHKFDVSLLKQPGPHFESKSTC